MTNKQWYRSLPNDLQDKIANNCNKLNKGYRFVEWYDDEAEVSLTGAFVWEFSPEGQTFWEGVNKTLK